MCCNKQSVRLSIVLIKSSRILRYTNNRCLQFQRRILKHTFTAYHMGPRLQYRMSTWTLSRGDYFPLYSHIYGLCWFGMSAMCDFELFSEKLTRISRILKMPCLHGIRQCHAIIALNICCFSSAFYSRCNAFLG